MTSASLVCEFVLLSTALFDVTTQLHAWNRCSKQSFPNRSECMEKMKQIDAVAHLLCGEDWMHDRMKKEAKTFRITATAYGYDWLRSENVNKMRRKKKRNNKIRPLKNAA